MSQNYKKLFEEFLELVFLIFLDSILVVFVGTITNYVKIFIEFIYGSKINEIENFAFYYIYYISKYLLISIVFIYAIIHLINNIKSLLKNLKS